MNLLPEQYKKELRYEAWRRFTIAFGLYLSIILVIANVLLLPPFFFILFQADASVDRLKTLQSSSEFREVSDSESRVKKVNTLLRVLTATENENKPITPILEDIMGRTSTSTSLSSLTFTRTTKGPDAIHIFGEARRDSDLQIFEDALKKSPYITGEPNSPITNYLKERNLKFTITLDLKL